MMGLLNFQNLRSQNLVGRIILRVLMLVVGKLEGEGQFLEVSVLMAEKGRILVGACLGLILLVGGGRRLVDTTKTLRFSGSYFLFISYYWC